MKLWGVFLILSLSSSTSSLFAETAKSEALVRVKLSSIAKSISVKGTNVSIQNKKTPFQTVGIPIRGSLTVQWVPSQKNEHLWLIQQGQNESEKKSPFLYIEGENLSLNGVDVPEKVFLWPNQNKLDVVGILEIDDYLKGVVPSEMPLDWPEEALKAQAVLARSYVLHQMKLHEKRYYHVDSSVLDQKYIYTLNWSELRRIKLKKILTETQGMVLKNSNNKTVKALYHADCGGKTERSENVWGRGESRAKTADVTVRDSGCPAGSNLNWTYEVSSKVLAQKLLLKGLVTQIKVEDVTTSGRPKNLLVQTTLEAHKITPQVLRSALGYKNIKSALFEVTPQGSQLLFKGKGFGHGVGLCQNGAKNLAKLHKNYKEILNHYFPQYRLGHL